MPCHIRAYLISLNAPMIAGRFISDIYSKQLTFIIAMKYAAFSVDFFSRNTPVPCHEVNTRKCRLMSVVIFHIVKFQFVCFRKLAIL